MPIATLKSKGQVTLPKAVRRVLGLETGDQVDFVSDESGGYRMVVRRKPVTRLRGSFAGRVAKPVTVEEMGEAVEAEAAARNTRAQQKAPGNRA